MSNKITCTCGHSWNKSSSSKKDMKICHICGKDNTMKNGGWLDSYDDKLQLGGYVYPVNYVPQAENGIEGTMGGLTDQGFDYNGAWGGTMQMGGSMPGAVGFTYARTGGIPSNGPYAKKTKASAQKGASVSDNTRLKPIVTEKPMNRGTIRSTEPFEPKDNRSIFSDSRAKERINSESGDFVQGLTTDTVIDQIPYSAYALTAKAINEGKPLTAISELVKQPLHLIGDVIVNALQENPKGIDVKTLEENTIPYARLAANALFGNPIITQIGRQRIESGKKKGSKSYLDFELPTLTEAAESYGVDGNAFTQFIENNWNSSGGSYKKILELADKKFPKKQNGGEMKFYQEGLDWKPRNISKQGSKIKKDDMGYWNPDNWGEPVEIGSNEITMQGVYEPLLGISDTGDTQMMYPGEDYTFDGESVTEYPVAQDGETLLKNKKVGQLETEIAKLNLRPIYPDFKTKIEYVSIPGCPEGAGCSKQATVNAQNITGLPYVSYAPADAAYRDAVAKRTGLKNIFDQEGSQKTSADSRGKGWKYPTSDDFKNWKAGDIVTLDAGSDYYFPYGAPKGYSSKDNYGQSHNGMVYGFTPEGRPIIKHGAEKGRDAGKSWTEVLGEDNRVTDLGHGRYAVKSVWRPKEVSDDGTISKIDNIVDLGKDAAKRKQDTTSNETFYLKNTDEERLMEDAAAAGEFSGASNRLNTKKKLVNLFNDEKLNKDLQYKFGITAEELDNLKPVVYGIFGQETNFNDIDSPAASFKEILGNMLGGNSRGAAQIKLKSLTPEERKILGVKKSSDLDSDEAAYKAALLMISNSKKRMDREVAQGTHPELANVDENFRAGYYYNSPARAITSAKDWAKKSKPSQWFNPMSWKNTLTTRERPDVFGRINPNYVNNAELRMDEGSYPYKLMENAKDLGVNVDFEKGRDLEEVVVRGTNKPK